MDRQFTTTHGPGDPQTWGFRQPTDDDDSGETWYEQLDRAEAAVCRRDWQTYRIAILNVHDISRSLFQ